jgi:hypothetical protein
VTKQKLSKLEAALQDTRAFLESLATSTATSNEQQATSQDFELRLWRQEEGTLSLDGSETRQFRICLAALIAAVIDSDYLSARAVETALQQAVFAVVDIPQRRAPEIEVRSTDAIRDLRQYLTRPPQRFRVVARVNGLADDGLPTVVGNVEFAKFDSSQLNYFRSAISRHQVSEDERQLRINTVAEESEELEGRTVAIVEVDAVEWEAAEIRAFREIRLALDIINFFSDLIPYNKAHLSLPGDASPEKVLVLTLQQDADAWGGYHINHRPVGGMGVLSLTKLREHDASRNIGFARISHLLGKRRSEFENKLISSFQWAGRATVDLRREEAFLLYAIALESFVLAEGDHQELNYRFRLRVAHLIGKTIEARRDVFVEMRELYKIRSRIVHSDDYQVTDANLRLMRQLTKGCLIRVCTSEDFTRMASAAELVQWFDERILG